jgi:hypothetical protein
MNRFLTSRPSPALVVAMLALFVSLGGVSYGVATGSIDSREIKDKSVRGKDLRPNSITARQIKRRSIDGTDIKINRVGGNAVKEEVLESGKLRKVPSAAAADTAASAANADRLGGKAAGDLDTRWALINEAGQIEQQTGGFTITDCYSTNDNCYINAGEDVRNNGLHAQIAVQNVAEIADANRLSGETGTAPCGATFVACAPPNTEDNNVLVVAPRDSAGAVGGAGNRFRFYVYVTGSQSG